VRANARVINLSVALAQPSSKSARRLQEALDYAAHRGTILVAASGNQGVLGSTVITRHPWVVPVVAYDGYGRPMHDSNLGSSIGRRGVGAPGDNITSLGGTGKHQPLGGTSAAAPFVSGSIALLWSLFPSASVGKVRSAIMQTNASSRTTVSRTTVTPPLLNAWAAYQAMVQNHPGR
jgi:subtilisin family serine protease